MPFGIYCIFLACFFYTAGVWSEKLKGMLRWRHAAFFWCGIITDGIGTGSMYVSAGNVMKINFHGLTGMAALFFMLIHAIWATLVLIQNDENMKKNFHKFGIIVWCIWLVPMVSGLIFNSISSGSSGF